MQTLSLKKIVEAEAQAIKEMELESKTEESFICPNCNGIAHIKKLPLGGYTSYCVNGCFSSKQ